MLNKQGLLYSLLFVLLLQSQSYNQTTSAIDTVYYSENTLSIKLRHEFIIQSSLKIYGKSSMIIPTLIDPIKGRVILNDSLKNKD